MKNLLLSVIMMVGLLLAGQLYAKNPSPVSQALDPQAAQTRAGFQRSESHKFSGLKLNGQLKKPDLAYIYKRKGLRSEKIVNIPENFNDEILQGAGQF